ncbi:hypothetical protein EDB83DRAFT_2414471, partial [Lactarius deliciosus]
FHATSCRKFHVRTFVIALFHILPHGVNTVLDYRSETVWEKPDGFVIPLTLLQVCALSLSACHTNFNPNRPNRTLRWVVVSPKKPERPAYATLI